MSLTHDPGARAAALPQEQGRDIFVIALQCHERFNDIESQSNIDSHIVARIPSLFSASSTDKPLFTLNDLQSNHEQFRVWAKNLGVFASSHSSLDFRLREADDMREGIMLLLCNLEADLLTCLERLKTDRSESLGTDPNISDDSSTGSESSELDEAIPSSIERTSYELQIRFRHIGEIIDKLFRLAGIIRASSIRGRTARAAAYTQFQDHVDMMDQFESKYLPQVLEHRFHLQDPLLGRFVKAVSLRRRRFMYQAKHQRRIVYGGEVLLETSLASIEPTLQSAIITKPIPNPTNELSQKEGETARVLSDMQAPTKATTFEAQQSRNKALSRLTSGSTKLNTAGTMVPPPPPLVDRAAYFECPYCCILLPKHMQGQKSWNAHVIEDLQPFICLEPHCSNPDEIFDSRAEWVEHQKWEHSLEWWCDCGDLKDTASKFTSAEEFAHHLEMSHKPSMSPEAITKRVSIVGRPKLLPFSCCPLCDLTPEELTPHRDNGTQSGTSQVVGRQKELQKHISHEMLAIFLVALPDRDDIECSDTHSEGQGKMRSTLQALSDSPLDFNHDESAISRPDDKDLTTMVMEQVTGEENTQPPFDGDFYHGLWQEVWSSPQLQDSVGATYTGLQKDPILRSFFDLQVSQYMNDDRILAMLRFSGMSDRRISINATHKHTCEWIFGLPAYERWRNTVSDTLWIKGKPGAGKSVLMKYLYQTISAKADQDIHLEFFFNARGPVLQNSMLGMLRSLLHQLYIQDPTNRQFIAKVTRQRELLNGEGLAWPWTQHELQAVFADAVIMSARQRPVIVFIDALDEAGYQPAQEILHYFRGINDRISVSVLPHIPTLRVCISCRHYPVLSAMANDTEVNVEEHNAGDIAMYVHDELKIRDWEDDSGRRHSLTDDLVQGAHGMFLWVVLTVSMISRKYQKGESLAVIQQQNSALPREMEYIFRSMIPEALDPQSQALSLSLFQWVCLAEQPLSVTELRFALAANDAAALPVPVRCHDTRNFIRGDGLLLQQIHGLSWGLVEEVFNTSGTAVVQVIHPSVVDFFLYKGLSLLANLQPQVSINPQSSRRGMRVSDTVRQGQGLLYRCCLSYLATEDIETAVRELEFARLSNHTGAPVLSPSSPFTTYATLNMLVHAEKAAHVRVMTLADEVRLLRSVIGCWTAAYRAIDKDSTRCPRVGSTVLHAAATAGLVYVVQYLIQNDVDVRDQEAIVALQLAVDHGRDAVIEALLSAGVDVNASDGHHGTMLHTAVSQGHSEIVARLLRAGADIDAWGRDHHGTALQVASYRGHLEIVERLLRAGANVEARGGWSATPLQIAMSQDHPEIIERLLQAGARQKPVAD